MVSNIAHTMARKDLLPGVDGDPVVPAIVADTRRDVIRARRRAALRDTANILLVAGIDWLFIHFPSTHIPAMTRVDSALLLLVINSAVIAYMIVARVLPRMAARRIAATWCLRERARFFQRPL